MVFSHRSFSDTYLLKPGRSSLERVRRVLMRNSIAVPTSKSLPPPTVRRGIHPEPHQGNPPGAPRGSHRRAPGPPARLGAEAAAISRRHDHLVEGFDLAQIVGARPCPGRSTPPSTRCPGIQHTRRDDDRLPAFLLEDREDRVTDDDARKTSVRLRLRRRDRLPSTSGFCVSWTREAGDAPEEDAPSLLLTVSKYRSLRVRERERIASRLPEGSRRGRAPRRASRASRAVRIRASPEDRRASSARRASPRPWERVHVGKARRRVHRAGEVTTRRGPTRARPTARIRQRHRVCA